MQCDMCGKEQVSLLKTMIEGVEMDVCRECAKFGKVVKRVSAPSIKEQKKKIEEKAIEKEEKTETVLYIVDDFATRVKEGREKKGLKQEELAKRLAEKESRIHNIESGSFRPSMKLARKLERFLRIKLIASFKKGDDKYKASSETLTIGDLLHLKKK